VQASYQPLFGHCFPFSNFPAILLPSVILFLSKSFPHQKAQSKRIKQKPKPKPQNTQAQKAKSPKPPSVGLL
jgi:hypothetical protein